MLFGDAAARVMLGDNGVTIPSGDYTVDAWFKTPIPKTGTWHTLFRGADRNGVIGDHQIIIAQDDDQLGYYSNAKEPRGFVGSGLRLSTLTDGWHRITVVNTGSSTSLYVDDVFISTGQSAGGNNVYSVGNYLAGGQAWGYAAAIKIYAKALNSFQIQRLTGRPGYPVLSVDVVGGQIRVGGQESRSFTVSGTPSVVGGPFGDQDGIFFSGANDRIVLAPGLDIGNSWTVDCYFKVCYFCTIGTSLGCLGLFLL